MRYDPLKGSQVGLLAAAVALAAFATPAQAQMRNLSVGGPNIHVGPRIPINPSVRYSPNLHYGPVIEDRIDSGPPRAQKRPPDRAPKKSSRAAAADPRYVPNEVLIEIAGPLPEAQAVSLGEKVKVAVIDSGIDADHPELAGSIEAAFDALDSKEKAHAHGTSIAGIIAAHATLKGAAPAAKLLAIRAFGEARSGASSTTFVVLKSLDYAVSNGAQIIIMSFAGPRDKLIDRGLAAASAKNIVLVAAVGNAGPKSAPLFPGADSHVIGVTATDASDAIFAKAYQSAYVAVAAPGVDILAPLPGGNFGVSSGTSLSAAYVSGLAALMLARNPALTADEVRQALTQSARDLGPAGRDDRFGAGEADAFAAVSAVAAPVATASEPPKSR